MQKYFLVFLLFISSVSFSQKFEEDRENFFRFGAKAGLNMNKISGTSFKNGFRYNFQAGAFLQFNFSPRFGVQPEVSFVQVSSEVTDDGSAIFDDFFGGGQHKAKLNYLEIPVLLNVNLGPSKRVKFQVGPAFGGLLKQTVDSLKAGTDLYKKTEWSAIAGLWLQVPVVNLGFRFKQGLTNINSIDNGQSWKNQAIQFFIGITF